MAGVSDWFSIGSTVACKTCYNKEIEGEVLAFDPQTKMLILSNLFVINFLTNNEIFEKLEECPSSSGRSDLTDVHLVNLSLVSDVQVKREVNQTLSEPPQSLNLQRLNRRVHSQIEEKKRMVKALQAGVSPEGQKLFLAIAKTIPAIRLAGQNIIVWDNVTIVPPYKLDNIHGNVESKPYQQVRKVVDKHMKDTAAASETPLSPQQSEQQQSREPQLQQPQTQKGGSTQ